MFFFLFLPFMSMDIGKEKSRSKKGKANMQIIILSFAFQSTLSNNFMIHSFNNPTKRARDNCTLPGALENGNSLPVFPCVYNFAALSRNSYAYIHLVQQQYGVYLRNRSNSCRIVHVIPLGEIDTQGKDWTSLFCRYGISLFFPDWKAKR